MSSDTAALKNELDQLLREVEQEANTVKGQVPDEKVDQTVASELEALAMEPEAVEDQTPVVNSSPNKGVSSMSNPNTDSNRSGSLNLDLSGEVTIDLKLNFGSQTVYISCDNENLMVQLGDGTSFRLPFSGAKAA